MTLRARPTSFDPGCARRRSAAVTIAVATAAALVVFTLIAPTVAAGSSSGRASPPPPSVRLTEPTEEYRAATCVFTIRGQPDGRSLRRLRQCGTTAKFSHPAYKLSVPSTWATWGGAPYVEDPAPPVIAVNNSRVTIRLLDGASAAGVEVQPATQASRRVTVRFLDERGRMVRRISQVVSGYGGARLFAVSTDRRQIKRIVIRVRGDAAFAIANLRVATVPVA